MGECRELGVMASLRAVWQPSPAGQLLRGNAVKHVGRSRASATPLGRWATWLLGPPVTRSGSQMVPSVYSRGTLWQAARSRLRAAQPRGRGTDWPLASPEGPERSLRWRKAHDPTGITEREADADGRTVEQKRATAGCSEAAT